MSIDRALRRARAAFERRMRATCTIRRVTGVTTDPLTGASTPIYDLTPVYSGKCYTRYPGIAFEQTPEAGGATLAVTRLVLRIPLGPAVLPGDVVTITADPDNPKMVGTLLRVASNDDMSQASAQRILCEDWQEGL